LRSEEGESLPEVLVPESKIQFINDEPKTTYLVVLKYRPYRKTPDANRPSESVSAQSILSSYKVYGDFKRLHDFIKCTHFVKDDGKPEDLPKLPTKLDQSGMKKPDAQMASDL